VIGETSAAAATSWMVTARPLRRADLLVVAKSFSPDGLRRACALRFPLRPHGVCGPAKPRCNEVISIARTAPPRHPAASRGLPALLLMLLAWTFARPALAEDGYDLWLRYKPLPEAEARQYLGLGGRVGRERAQAAAVRRKGALVVGTPASVPQLASLQGGLEGLGEEGYLIREARIDGRKATVVAANSDHGALYGSFHLLRLVQSGEPLAGVDVRESPKVKLRVLNHWDNLDRYVERGYAGESIWDWHRLPDWLDPRYTDYARANASIGINGTVLNNVNTSAQALTPL